MLAIVGARFLTPVELCLGKGKTEYLNINLVYECWKDIKVAFLHFTDRAPAIQHLPWVVWWWTVLNMPSFAVLKLGHMLCRAVSSAQ